MHSNFFKQLFLRFLKARHIARHFQRFVTLEHVTRNNGAQSFPPELTQALIKAALNSPDQLYQDLGSRPEGLNDAEIQQLQHQYGLNEIQQEKPLSWWVHLWLCYRNPFNLLLTLLAVVSYLTDDMQGAVVIGTMVLVSTFLRFWQEMKSNKAADALKAMVTNTATVIRQVPENVVLSPDSVSMMGTQQGQEIAIQLLVPGDIILLSAGDMIPADCRILSAKDLFVAQAAMTGESLPVEKYAVQKDQDAVNPLDLENILFMGTNVVSGYAMAIVLATGSHTYFGALAKRVTASDRATTSFQLGVNKVSWLLIRFMAIMAPIVLLINGFTKGDWTQASLFALSVAVGLTPEMLPMIVTSTLAKGAVFLSRKKVIVKRLDAIQNFGAMDVLCTDKTGTLTQDKIFLERHVDIWGENSEKVLELAYLNSYFQTGLKNLLDVAVLEFGKNNIPVSELQNYKKVDEIPFDFNRRRMSVVVEDMTHQQMVITKGAVEEILSVCRYVMNQDEVVDLDDTKLAHIREVTARLNAEGLRVVAVATKAGLSAHEYGVADESDLILVGYVAFLDPPKESTAPAIQALTEHGIAVKILTGDNDLVTAKVCREVGLNVTGVVLGSDIEKMTESELAQAVEQYNVFAKLTPAHKERIVSVLKSNGHVVGFMGDGINDAPALRSADIGISVDTAVDIAKEAADIILLEKSLMVLEQGVLEGRRTFSNMLKYIKMTASSNFGNVFSVLIASAFIPFLPMLPLHLLVQNLLYDVSQIAIPFDHVDDELLQKPQKWQPAEIGRFMIFFGPISSIFDVVTFVMMWFIFDANTSAHQTMFQSGWFVVGLVTQTLIVHMIRTPKIPFLQSRASMPLMIMTLIIMAIGIYLPMGPFASYFKLQALPPMYFVYLPCIVIAYMALTQLVKHFYVRRYGWQ
ncbi:magnesium-translocating P-type ATPase [Acinetobacter sp.]|uniref:magnesium-translocating P-type ATPase n=1 Tax=Acinetobacter sp. TaxID=472 RepID=UPI0031DFC445